MRSDNVTKGAERAPNRSLFYALGYTPEDLEKPLIAVVSAHSDIVPGHMNLDKLTDAVKSGIEAAGGTPFMVPAIGVCDGIAMGHVGMKYSLASRELICDSVETMFMAHQFDGCVLVPNCDKIVPGMVMAAVRMNVPAVVCSRKALGSQAAFEAAISQALAEHGAELIVMAGFMSILTENFTSQWPRRILNIHPSLIPSFCGKGFYGLKVHEAALAYGVKVTGATVHFVNEVPDGGEILLQKAVDVLPGDTPEVLQRRVMEQAEWKLLPQAAQMISEEIGREKAE